MMVFRSWYFLFLIPVIIYLLFFFPGRKKSSLKFSSVRLLMSYGMKKTIWHKIGRYLIVLGLLLATVGMARPQLEDVSSFSNQKGIDIVVVLDVSLSMQSIDFSPNRLEVAKRTIDKFINGRNHDRIALVVFKATAHTLIPLTVDHDVLRETLKNVGDDSVVEDGTAIGMAVTVGLNRLKKSDAVSKVIILVTDGENNAGAVDPRTAADMARDLDIKIYTIGVGTNTTIIPDIDNSGAGMQIYDTGIDEELLKYMSDTTGGKFFRANNPNALSGIFADIDELEKTEFEQGVTYEYTELGFTWIKAALFMLMLGITLDRFLLIRIP